MKENFENPINQNFEIEEKEYTTFLSFFKEEAGKIFNYLKESVGKIEEIKKKEIMAAALAALTIGCASHSKLITSEKDKNGKVIKYEVIEENRTPVFGSTAEEMAEAEKIRSQANLTNQVAEEMQGKSAEDIAKILDSIYGPNNQKSNQIIDAPPNSNIFMSNGNRISTRGLQRNGMPIVK